MIVFYYNTFDKFNLYKKSYTNQGPFFFTARLNFLVRRSIDIRSFLGGQPPDLPRLASLGPSYVCYTANERSELDGGVEMETMFGLLKGGKCSEKRPQRLMFWLFRGCDRFWRVREPLWGHRNGDAAGNPGQTPQERTLVEDSPNTPTPSTQIMRITDGKTPMDTELVMMYRLMDKVRDVRDMLDMLDTLEEENGWYKKS